MSEPLPIDDPELRAIADGKSQGDKIALGPDGKPVKVDHPSALTAKRLPKFPLKPTNVDNT